MDFCQFEWNFVGLNGIANCSIISSLKRYRPIGNVPTRLSYAHGNSGEIYIGTKVPSADEGGITPAFYSCLRCNVRLRG